MLANDSGEKLLELNKHFTTEHCGGSRPANDTIERNYQHEQEISADQEQTNETHVHQRHIISGVEPREKSTEVNLFLHYISQI